MAIIELRPISRADEDIVPVRVPPESDSHHEALRALLLGMGSGTDAEIPPLADLISAGVHLAEGSRRKVILPLEGRPAEFTFVRRADDVLVSHYDTSGMPEIVVLDRRISLQTLLSECGKACEALSSRNDRSSQSAYKRLAERASLAACTMIPDAYAGDLPIELSGGAEHAPSDQVPLAFGFEATIFPGVDPVPEGSARADVHATLFDGRLWAFARGRRIALAKGPVLLVVQRMVAAVRTLLDAWIAEKSVHVRMRSGAFVVGVRLERGNTASVTLGSTDESTLTLTALQVPEAAEPMLKLANELIRAVSSADRAQVRNLRFVALRDEVRALRRIIRERTRRDGFVNADPERLRLASPPSNVEASESGGSNIASPAGRLRFAERWRAEIEGLDAASTFLCGDRLVVATPRRVIALERDGGEILWSRRTPRAASMMVGTSLLRLSPDGVVELWDVGEGEAYARAQITPRAGGVPVCSFASGSGIPPTAVLAEGQTRLVAIDLRTGEPRWRFRARSGTFRMKRAGRILLVTCGDGTVHALDVVSGEVVWRLSEPTRFSLMPTISRDIALVVSGEIGTGPGALYGLDLYSGQMLWRRDLDAGPSSAPLGIEDTVCVPMQIANKATLAAFNPADGSLRWMTNDPGVGRGGAALAVDRSLVINAPGGRVTSLDLATGAERWTQSVAPTGGGDVPRRLEPILRGGALFVPASSVHALRPSDGSVFGATLECDLIPDVLRVDERGWLYVAEESGHVRAYAPAPQLSLVK